MSLLKVQNKDGAQNGVFFCLQTLMNALAALTTATAMQPVQIQMAHICAAVELVSVEMVPLVLVRRNHHQVIW